VAYKPRGEQRDITELLAVLNNSKLQITNNPAYQTIAGLIRQLQTLKNDVNATFKTIQASLESISGGSSTGPTTIDVTEQATFGFPYFGDGLDGEDSYIPGPQGIPGVAGAAGANGSIGVNGLPGLDGLDGEDSLIPGPRGLIGPKGGLQYRFNTATGASDPGTGQFNYSGTTFADLGILVINYFDIYGNDLTTFIESWDDSTSSPTGNGGYLILQDQNTLATLAIVEVANVTSLSATYAIVSGTAIAWSGAVPASGAQTVILFTRTGDKGVAGDTGPTGARGLPGIPGLDADEPEYPYSVPGPAGTNGSTGSQGPIGIPGQDAEEPEYPYLIPGPAGSSSAATVNVKQTEIDFGTTPVSEAEFTIVDADVSATSQIIGTVAYEAPTDKDLDELEMDALDLKFGAGVGQFTLYVVGMNGYIADKFKINYLVG
tara:strand:- start:494 stop:1789 length:1296 start_codon:yes stop_codon:yes gene_type:complete